MESAELVSLLGKNDAFDTTPQEALEALVKAAEVMCLEDSSQLINQGKSGESIWLLLEGDLDVLVDGDLVNQVSTKGEVVGEISAVSQTPATATVQSKGEVKAMRIPHEALHEVMKSTPELAASMLRSMAKYLGRR
ncbi:MAG: cyclic nucleotide-binding domain-containing protein [Verrucomicrobiales bacterium]|nr:cyclic nucleotide-binding domain-containing protein [Verrucomicrobiales bacterium]